MCVTEAESCLDEKASTFTTTTTTTTVCNYLKVLKIFRVQLEDNVLIKGIPSSEGKEIVNSKLSFTSYQNVHLVFLFKLSL